MTDFSAMVDFKCLQHDCDAVVEFNIMGLKKNNGVVSCPTCHHQVEFNEEFIGKLEKLRNLLIAVQEAEDILGDCNVGVTTPAGEIKVPYRLLLTRLNSLLTLDVAGEKVDFAFRIEPIAGSFR
jgi:hypothetical protein